MPSAQLLPRPTLPPVSFRFVRFSLVYPVLSRTSIPFRALARPCLKHLHPQRCCCCWCCCWCWCFATAPTAIPCHSLPFPVVARMCVDLPVAPRRSRRGLRSLRPSTFAPCALCPVPAQTHRHRRRPRRTQSNLRRISNATPHTTHYTLHTKIPDAKRQTPNKSEACAGPESESEAVPNLIDRSADGVHLGISKVR